MENKINIAEILRNCPKGMELYSPIFGKVYLDKIRPHLAIVVTTDKEQGDFKEEFLYDGRYGMNGECMLFPSKGKTTWEGFVPPCKFNDGDVVVAEGKSCQLFLLKHVKYREDNIGYDGYCYFGWDCLDNRLFEEGNWGFNRLATEEEKAKLFDTIKINGYKWDEETKTLEKIIPKFKVGDRIVHKVYKDSPFTITEITNDCYKGGTQYAILIEQQDNFELVPNKFDINTLIAFESRVLIRDYNSDKWHPGIWGFYDKDTENYPYKLIGDISSYCIPYEGNAHLLGTTDDCDDFYKTWE